MRPGSLLKTDTGTLVLSGTNTYVGSTSVNAGTLRAGSAGAFGASYGFLVGAGATLDLNGFNKTFGDLGGAGTVTGANVTIANGVRSRLRPRFVDVDRRQSRIAVGRQLLGGGQSDDVVVCRSHGNRDDQPAQYLGQMPVFAAGSYVSKEYTILTATGGVSGTFGSLVNYQSAGGLLDQPELRRQRCLSEPGT